MTEVAKSVHRHVHYHVHYEEKREAVRTEQAQATGAQHVHQHQHLHFHGDHLARAVPPGAAFCHPGGVPAPGALPAPSLDQSAAPAGRGLRTNPEGWPANTVETAGGYHVVAQGATNWAIFAPGQKATDTPHTRVFGDPHVLEKDGTRWDHTRSSDWVLGDGTRIFSRTSAETGQSVTVGLDLANGQDHVSITNLDKQPVMSAVRQDGYEWRAAHLAQDPNRDTFHLRGDQTNVHWVRERGGQVDGVVTGAQFDAKTNRYEQTIDASARVGLDPSLRPAFGSRAWGNQVRSELDDTQARFLAQVAQSRGYTGDAAVAPAVWNAGAIHQDHRQGAWQADQRDWAALAGQGFGQPGLWGGGFGAGGFGAWGGGLGASGGGPGAWGGGAFDPFNGLGALGPAGGFGGFGSYFQDPRAGLDALLQLRALLSGYMDQLRFAGQSRYLA